jgi:hypothetical protein
MTNWGTDDLTQFLEAVYHNQQVNRTRLAEPYSVVQRINDCFMVAGKTLVNPNPIMTGPLFLRSQYAYKTAAGMALAGQIVEAFPMMRSCLEYAGYALAMFATPTIEDTPTLQEVFLSRHVDAASLKAQRAKFQVGNIIEVIGRFDPQLAKMFKTLYDHCIDFGAHPNPSGTLQAMTTEKTHGSIAYTTLALATDTTVLLRTMKKTAQVGLTALLTFQYIFQAKFESLGVLAEIDALRTEQFLMD